MSRLRVASTKRRWIAVPAIAVVSVLVLGAAGAAAHVKSQATTPGYDGKTIQVAGLITATPNFPDAALGAQARIKRANDDNELKGVKIKYVDSGDDKNDATTNISEARRLVEQDGVFAIVPAVSSAMGDYLNTAKVPYFGWGISSGPAYCGTGDKGYGFGFTGCVLPTNPKAVPAFSAGNPYKYLTEVKGIKNPTAASIGTDDQNGAASMKSFIAQAEASGLKVVYAKHILPPPPAVVGDYTPYAQQIMASNGGKGPDMVWTTSLNSGLNLPKALANAGYKGLLVNPYYSTSLLKPLAGTLSVTSFAPFEQSTAGTKQMVDDLNAFKPGTTPNVGSAAGYFGADFFIQAVKKAGTKNLTRASLQKAAAHMTYQIKDTVGPTQYPRAFQALNSYCGAMVQNADGTGYTVAEPFACTNKFKKVSSSSPDQVG